MATRQLQTSHPPVTCEICGRSLLRGEHAADFRDGPESHTVCELCTGRALGVGWVREGSLIANPTQTRTVRALTRGPPARKARRRARIAAR